LADRERKIGDTETLTVLAAPTVTVSSPREGQVFDFGQQVKARYTCQEAPGGPGITDCSGDAASGSPIDTSVSGPQTFTVTAVSDDGQVTTQTIDYTVLPDNRFVIRSIAPRKNGAVTLALQLPGPGRVQVLETAPTANIAAALTVGAGRFSFGQLTRKVGAAGRLKLTVAPAARGRRLVAKHRHAVYVRVVIAYTPTGGKTRVRSIGAVRIPG
jgi:hypothetical protein